MSSFKNNGITYSVERQGNKWVIQATRENGVTSILGQYHDQQSAEHHMETLKKSHNAKSRYSTQGIEKA